MDFHHLDQATHLELQRWTQGVRLDGQGRVWVRVHVAAPLPQGDRTDVLGMLYSLLVPCLCLLARWWFIAQYGWH